MSWFKKKKIIEVEKIKPSIDEILNNPWEIHKIERSKNKFVYCINVFRFDESEWEDLSTCSKAILGVTRKEFCGYMSEIYDVTIRSDFADNPYIRFKKLEEVNQLIEMIRPYYDSYHIPRAVMDRLTRYDEENGGLPVPIHIKSRWGNVPGTPFQLKSVK